MLNVQSKYYASNPLGVSGNYDRITFAPYYLPCGVGYRILVGKTIKLRGRLKAYDTKLNMETYKWLK